MNRAFKLSATEVCQILAHSVAEDVPDGNWTVETRVKVTGDQLDSVEITFIQSSAKLSHE